MTGSVGHYIRGTDVQTMISGQTQIPALFTG